ncbi:helicase-related protein [Polaribacter sp. NJDZ03]|uniref:helicase-related protein n=1 Tax=Polaribacter sp. NJDZ03 TaxID=2855841 RepID=UPI001C4A0F27|nr:helicase-related protein [Polaribacter sp. NJDZ03]
MILSEAEARKIINLNPYDSIDNEIAERQFQVILKGFNCLIQEDSDMLYIADEVGLGKTYVALGIASLLRHFSTSERRAVYKDVILVPKRNLQYKWTKEINNFINHNYLLECNIVKSVLGTSVGNCNDSNIHNKLEGFNTDYTSYEVYRNSSFSIATSDNYDWKTKLENELPEDIKPYFNEGRTLYKGPSEIYLKRLFAFLLNISFPEVDLLIVDEAHNFKHGIDSGVSIRNQVVSRLMGVIIPEDNDFIFNHFPELKSRITQKVKKVIFLSATPIDNGLYELKQQLDCFLPKHKFKKAKNVNEEVKAALNTFMIRGLMKIKLDKDGDVSRNMYRHEHRRGNVVKKEDANPQYIEDDLESIIIGLLQLKTLKHFNESNNRSFEIGMLAGFETFKTQEHEEKEFEDSNQNANKAADHNVIKQVAESYFDTFDKHLPHPKQDNLIRVLIDGLKHGHKSLVFVRRIASVIELERKLTFEVENWHYSKIKKYLKRHNRLKQLDTSFKERHQIFDIENVLKDLSYRVYESYKKDYHELIVDDLNDPLQLVNEYLIAIYNSDDENKKVIQFRDNVKQHIGLKNIKLSLKEIAKELIDSHLVEKKENDEFDENEEFLDLNEDVFGYFFSSYFSSKRYIEGFNFRKRVATKDWYRFNNYYLKDSINDIAFDSSKLKIIKFKDKDRTEAKRIDVVNDNLLDALILKDKNNVAIDSYYKKKTFFNYLFEGILKNEFDIWVSSKWKSTSKKDEFLNDFNALIDILQGVFRNGSGLLPAYIAECLVKDNFEKELVQILKNSFPEVLSELKQIINDFDKIMTTNFSDKDKIKRALYGQQPIVGVSGSHKRDVSRVATQFRMPGYPYVLITTDILKEGEDLHLYCKDVYHYGIAWNPSDMEQRTGRIDRINSSCYFDLKRDGENSFNNSLQVFYPYLADTLEVNQVAKVFNKMNDFIETFYDISIVSEKDTKVATDEIVKEIPKQIKTLLSSTYDFENFKGVSSEDKSELIIKNSIGHKKADLLKSLNEMFQFIKSSFTEFNSPTTVNERSFTIKSNIKLNGRRAPLKILLVKGEFFGSLLYSVESIICRSNDLRSRREREEIRNYLDEYNLNFIEGNSFLLVQSLMSLNEEPHKQLTIIKKVIKFADSIEEKYLGIDQVSF